MLKEIEVVEGQTQTIYEKLEVLRKKTNEIIKHLKENDR